MPPSYWLVFRWCRATCLRATAQLRRRSTPRCSRRPSTRWTRTEVSGGGEDDLYTTHLLQERGWDCHGAVLRLTSTWSTGWDIYNICNSTISIIYNIYNI